MFFWGLGLEIRIGFAGKQGVTINNEAPNPENPNKSPDGPIAQKNTEYYTEIP